MEERERYAAEARIFADGKIITKVRPALPEEETAPDRGVWEDERQPGTGKFTVDIQ